MKNHVWALVLKASIPIILMSSCVKGDSIQPAAIDPPLFTSPADFNYETSKDVGIDIRLLSNNDDPLKQVLVDILDKPEEDGGKIIFTALTDNNGKINTTLKLPTHLKNVIVDPKYIGVMRNATVRVESNKILCTLGGKSGYGGNVEAEQRMPLGLIDFHTSGREQSLTYKYMGTYDNIWGRPNYMEPLNDVISPLLLSWVNASLPEQKPVPAYHPVYLNPSAETNLNLTQDGDVYITFVHEGAGYTNTLAYFTYPTNNKPTNINAVDSVNIIFPNASLTGSSGNLTSGNKVKLGRFKANTSIGFCLVANGWNRNTKVVEAGNGKFFSIDELNPEVNVSRRRHSILLNDNTHNLFLVGMEDINREQNGCDHDFNDIIFYATSVNSANAISTTNMNPIDKPGDADNDGVSDVYDQFPNDAGRAYINWYPSAYVAGTVAYEDTWPNTGDYDMNDLVVGYKYKMINNAANNTVEMYAQYALRAAGATIKNGFGVQFPFASSVVSSVTGAELNNAYPISLNSNGTEAGQTNAVIIPFNDFFYLMQPPGGGIINTQPGVNTIKPDTVNIKISFTSPLSATALGLAPFNQFLVATEDRGREVHLPGEKPTSRANTKLFNTQKDNTIPIQNRYYKTITNLPFGIGLPEGFDYPIESKPINNVYYHFAEWAQSGGSSYPDWYTNKPGYRATNLYYK